MIVNFKILNILKYFSNTGKGQFICGNKLCDRKEALKSWEVNFAYKENEEKKNALVKLREFFQISYFVMIIYVYKILILIGLCSECSEKLNYVHKKKEVTETTDTATTNEQEISKKVDDFLQSLLV